MEYSSLSCNGMGFYDMKVLFVCTNNITRSLMAEAFFNRLSRHQSASAGVKVGERNRDGQTIKEIADDPSGPEYLGFTMDIMKEEGFDISRSVSKQVTSEMVEAADKVVVMTRKEWLPDYLEGNEKVVFWSVRVPAESTRDSFVYIKDQVMRQVEELVAEIE